MFVRVMTNASLEPAVDEERPNQDNHAPGGAAQVRSFLHLRALHLCQHGHASNIGLKKGAFPARGAAESRDEPGSHQRRRSSSTWLAQEKKESTQGVSSV